MKYECNKNYQEIIERSLKGGGETNRLVSKKMKQSNKKNSDGDGDCDEYPGYARFVEEATIGYSAMQVGVLRFPLNYAIDTRLEEANTEPCTKI